jgi:SAM-dependent methyltransferase
MGAVYRGIPPGLGEALRRAFTTTTFVETGTYLGDTAAWAAERFERVVTIEAFEPLFRAVAERFASLAHVERHLGDSPKVLKEIVASLDRPALFWLDAHWSGAGTAGETAECPLLAEIASIDESPHRHIILIDDARLFMAPPPPPHRVEDWPDLKRVTDALLRLDPDGLVAIVDDVIVRVPGSGRKQFVAFWREEQEPSAPQAPSLLRGGDCDTMAALRERGLWREGGPLRLHLGCGETRLEGYVNVDYPSDWHNVMAVRPDLEADLTTLALPAGSVDEIRLHHVFEHFNRIVALGLLIRWRGWLKDGGLVVIETPDFVATARAALEARGADRMALVRHLEGDQTAAWGYHVGQWHPERFERTLAALGFVDIAIEETSTGRWHRVGLGNVTVRAAKRGERPLADLIAATEAVLWESTVADAERPTFEVWRRQLRDFLAGDGAPAPPSAHATIEDAALPPLDPVVEHFLRTLEARRADPPPTLEIQAFNERNRDAWVAGQARAVPAGARVLDVGAGTCPYRPLFAHARYEAHDFAQYEGYRDPERQEGLYGTMDYVSDVTAIPVPDSSFDAILCTEVLEHVPEPIAAVAEMARILKPGGTMLLTAPLASGLHQEPYHFYGGYTPHWYRMVAERFGLAVEEISANGGTFRHIAQECARVAWTMERHAHLHGDLAPAVGHLFGELLPRFLTSLDDRLGDAQFTVAYHVRLRKL